MKRMLSLTCMAVALFLFLALCPLTPAFSQTADMLNVEAVVCRNVVDRTPVDANTSFPSSVEKLYCFSKIMGATTPTRISHVWYYGNTEMFRISLPVNSISWRTYSSKNIQPYQTGSWHVEILDASENKLEVINFQISEP